MRLTAPVPLAEHHDLSQFACGVGELDAWLNRRARANQASGATRCFVVCEVERVIAYYALASGAIRTAEANGRLRRNMPDPIPMAVLARLAIDVAWQGRGLGRALARDAIQRVLAAAEIIGVRGVLVHAISEDAKAFYLALGFTPSPVDAMTLMASLRDLQLAASSS